MFGVSMLDEAKPVRRLTLLSKSLVVPFTTEEAGRWPAITGQLRPATPKEAREYYDAVGRSKDEAAAFGIRNKFYADHIASWDVVDEAGTVAAVTPETVASLPVPVWDQLGQIVLGFSGGDVLKN